MQKKIKINNTTCICNDNGVSVKYSYLMSYGDVENFCNLLKEKTGDRYKRTAASWKREVIAHNILYKANLFKIHVVDTDLAEHEQLHRRMAYGVIYVIASIAHLIGRN